MIRFASTTLFVALAAASLAACNQQSATDGATSAALAGMVPTDVGAPADSSRFASLSANQRVQGSVELDIGNGPRSYRAVATTLDSNLGEVAAERLATREGQASLARANERVAGKVTVDAAQVQAFAQSMAGRTIYQAEMRHIDIIKLRQISVTASAADGSQVSLGLEFPLDSDTLSGASLEYFPDGNRMRESFGSSNDGGPMEVVIDRFEALDDSTYAVSGTFVARQLNPGVLAKDLKGKQLAEASGRFDIAEVKLR